MSAERLALVKTYCLPLRTWRVAGDDFASRFAGARLGWPRNVSERWA